MTIIPSSSGKQAFRPHARLISVLWDQLITDKKVAVVELIKNSYDADADEVNLRFNIWNDWWEEKIVEIEVEDDSNESPLNGIW